MIINRTFLSTKYIFYNIEMEVINTNSERFNELDERISKQKVTLNFNITFYKRLKVYLRKKKR